MPSPDARPDDLMDLFPDHLPDNICYLQTTRAARIVGIRTHWHSAGTLIGGEYLVTAAHNVYDSARSTLVGMTVACKSTTGEIVRSTLSRADIEHTREVSHYDRTFATDYAFLRLPRPLPVAEEAVLNRDVDLGSLPQVEVAGYPDGVLRYGAGPITSPNRQRETFSYGVDTAKGMSGGPVWARLPDGRVLLVGVHVMEAGARRVDAGMLGRFDAWRGATTG